MGGKMNLTIRKTGAFRFRRLFVFGSLSRSRALAAKIPSSKNMPASVFKKFVLLWLAQYSKVWILFQIKNFIKIDFFEHCKRFIERHVVIHVVTRKNLHLMNYLLLATFPMLSGFFSVFILEPVIMNAQKQNNNDEPEDRRFHGTNYIIAFLNFGKFSW